MRQIHFSPKRQEAESECSVNISNCLWSKLSNFLDKFRSIKNILHVQSQPIKSRVDCRKFFTHRDGSAVNLQLTFLLYCEVNHKIILCSVCFITRQYVFVHVRRTLTFILHSTFYYVFQPFQLKPLITTPCLMIYCFQQFILLHSM